MSKARGFRVSNWQDDGPWEVQAAITRGLRPKTRWWRFDLHLGRLTLSWNLSLALLPAGQLIRYDGGTAWMVMWLKFVLLYTPFPIPKERP